jgi:DNA replication protein DnaC
MEKIDTSVFNLKQVSNCSKCSDGIFMLEGSKREIPELCDKCYTEKIEKEKVDKLKSRVEYLFDSFKTDKDEKKRLGIPSRYIESSLENFIGDVDKQVEKWISLKGENLLIQSPKAGNGKTHLAISVMCEKMSSMRDRGLELSLESYQKSSNAFKEYEVIKPTGMFVNFADLMLEVKASFDSKDINEQDVITKYTNYTILVIDDIGTEKSSDYTQAVIYSILNRRYESMKSTIITTNLSSGDITGSYGSRILSRIASGEVITLNGEDMRLKRV